MARYPFLLLPLSRAATALAGLALVLTSACSSADSASAGTDEPASAEAAATVATGASDRSTMSRSVEEVWLFGGTNADVLLGCVTCNESSGNSVLNEYGRYGSDYSDTIWNDYGKYGSDYSATSPWNEYAAHPPHLYTKDKGRFYGVFTVKEYAWKRTHLDAALAILERGREGRR